MGFVRKGTNGQPSHRLCNGFRAQEDERTALARAVQWVSCSGMTVVQRSSCAGMTGVQRSSCWGAIAGGGWERRHGETVMAGRAAAMTGERLE